MNDYNELPFSQVLSALFENEQLPIHLVYKLSDLSSDQLAEFKQAWPRVSDDRRSAIVHHMVDIAEESYLVNFDAVCGCLFEDVSPVIRMAALDVIWDSTETDLIPAIVNMLQWDTDVAVRAGAARALAHYVLLGEWGEINPTITAPVVDTLLAEYDKTSTSLEVKRAALEAVAPAAGSHIADKILVAYEDGPFELQLSAVFAMGNTADNRWLPIIEDEFESLSAEMRAEAARAAGAIGDSRMIDGLQRLLGDDEADVCVAAIYAIGQIGGERALQILTDLSEDPDFEELYDIIDEALDEMDWVVSEFDLLSFSEDEDDDLLDELRLN